MSGQIWVTEPNQYLEPKVTEKGFGSRTPITINEQFKNASINYKDNSAMGLKRPKNGVIPAEWKIWTWKSYYDESTAFAKSVIKLGLKPFDIINILGFNSPEWLMSNNGAILAGCIAAGIYATNSAEACQYITSHSKAGIVVLEDNKQLAKYAAMEKSSLVHLKAFVIWIEIPDAKLISQLSVPVYTWETFLALGTSVTDAALEKSVAHIKPGHCSTLIYTSGTTGPPKAVMSSHDNITWTTANMVNYFKDDPLNTNDRVVSYLPLSHIAAQLIDIHVTMQFGGCTYFCQPDALKGTLTVSMRDVRPTIFFGVPRVWEKIQEKMVQIGRANTGIKAHISAWAKSTGKAYAEAVQYGNNGRKPFGYGCANSLIFSKITEVLGLDKCRANFTAAAPISIDVLRYFASLNLHIYEVFGQSECTGPHTVSNKGIWKLGACGRPMPGTISKVDPDTKELCYTGRHIFMGYMYMPDKTAETFDADGFLRSGDVAEFDENDDKIENPIGPSGFMKITGRIKELIITAGGENIPPVLIENEMKATMVALSNVIVIGDQKKYLTMLVTLKTEVDSETGVPTNKLAADALFIGKQIGSTATTTDEALVDPLWSKYIDDGMKKANSKTTSSAQNIQKWNMLPVDLSEKAGDLTPTLKLKRNVVVAKFAKEIDSIYHE